MLGSQLLNHLIQDFGANLGKILYLLGFIVDYLENMVAVSTLNHSGYCATIEGKNRLVEFSRQGALVQPTQIPSLGGTAAVLRMLLGQGSKIIRLCLCQCSDLLRL